MGSSSQSGNYTMGFTTRNEGEKRGRSLCERRGEKRGGNKVKSEERKGWKRKGGWRREDVGEEEKKGGKEKEEK